MLFNLFSDSAMLSWARTLRLRPSFVRLYSSVLPTKPVPCSRTATLASEHVAAHVSRDIAAVNSRLQNLQLTASYLSSGQPLLGESVFFFYLFPFDLFSLHSFSLPFLLHFIRFHVPSLLLELFTILLCSVSLLYCYYSFLVPIVLPPSMLFSLCPFLFPLLPQSLSMRFAVALLISSVADLDPGSGAFLIEFYLLALGSGICFFRIPNPKPIFLRA